MIPCKIYKVHSSSIELVGFFTFDVLVDLQRNWPLH
uniref:Uncharacterized protein n=1 Tax=Arundo donax TaxID=35708 RepID=A0A0A9C4Y2_ARUDO